MSDRNEVFRQEALRNNVQEIKVSNRQIVDELREINHVLREWHREWKQANLPPSATSLTLNVQGGQMASFTINTVDGLAELQFEDSAGNAVAGPNDSVTGEAIAPAVVSDTPTVLAVAASVAGATPGSWTAALTPVAVGSANLSVSPLVNSDGTPVNETVGPNAGQPFELPAPVAVTVGDGGPTGLTLAVTG